MLHASFFGTRCFWGSCVGVPERLIISIIVPLGKTHVIQNRIFIALKDFILRKLKIDDFWLYMQFLVL